MPFTPFYLILTDAPCVQPMFVMFNDGGVLEKEPRPYTPERLLLQRLPMFQLITQGLPLALLRGAEFRDSKVSLYHISSNAVLVLTPLLSFSRY